MNAVRGLARLNVLRRICKPTQRVNFQLVRQSSGHSHEHDHHDEDDTYNYRLSCYKPEDNRQNKILTDVLMTFTWWWMLWHIFTEPEVLFGTENPATYPELWTDEELGIPPDDE